MKKFLIVLVGLIMLMIVLANLGPMLLLGASVWFLYLSFKQFMKTESTFKKVGWGVLGLIILSIAVSNSYAVIGVVAGYVLYLLYKEWKGKKYLQQDEGLNEETSDPFMNFEKQWAELTK